MNFLPLMRVGGRTVIALALLCASPLGAAPRRVVKVAVFPHASLPP